MAKKLEKKAGKQAVVSYPELKCIWGQVRRAERALLGPSLTLTLVADARR